MSNTSKKNNKIKDTGNAAWKDITTKDLLPTPETYHVLYAYFEGKSPDIAHAIDMIKEKEKTISDKDVANIYRTFISNRRQENAVEKAGNQMYDTVLGLSSKIDIINTENKRRGARLSEVTGKMDGQQTPEHLREIIDTVVVDTHEILRDNTILAQELNKSKIAMAALQQDLENTKKEAARDSLTGLLNRKSFDEALISVEKSVPKEKANFSLLMLDIDYFKKFNDTYGHQVGDQVLKLVASTLKTGVKGGDIVARYGGEEFAIILPKTTKENAFAVAEHVRDSVSSKDIINRGTGKVLGQIRLSVGVSEYKPGEALEDLIERADKALYEAKNNGRNQTIISKL
jgi:diguanylate cyclase